MARMIPPDCSAATKSSGEREIFELFRTDPGTKNWVVLHSLGLSEHVERLYGEIDFLVLAPGLGVFALEVKAGRVKRQDGVWVYTDRYGRDTKSNVGPFRQALEGMHSLKRAVTKKLGPRNRLSKIVYGFGAMFPHIVFDIREPEFEPWQVYDRQSRRLPVSEFVRRLSEETHAKVSGQEWYDPNASRPTAEDVNGLLGILRGDFERVVRPSAALERAERGLLQLTEEQYAHLDSLEDNDRCLFDGAAGTGKTLLAMEHARRRLGKGDRVLLLCYNKLLGHWLGTEFAKAARDGRVVASSIHRYLDVVIARSSVAADFRELQNGNADPSFFSSTYPLYALSAIEETVTEPFDVLVIDEGQDLLTPEYLDVMDALLKGGLAGGRWAIFCDFQRQAIYTEASAKEMKEGLAKRAPWHAKFRLTVNCRNTRPIGEETAILSGFEVPPFLPSNVEGPPVGYRFAATADTARKALDEILREVLKGGIRPSSIVILSPVSYERSCAHDWRGPDGITVSKIDADQQIRPSEKSVWFSTIQAFKGLENSIVILVDIDRIDDDRARSLLYVGMSRARQGLFMVLSEKAREPYQAAVRQRIMKAGAAR